MNKEDRIARALNDIGSSNFSKNDRAALSDFVSDFFVDTDSLNSKFNLILINQNVSIIQCNNRRR